MKTENTRPLKLALLITLIFLTASCATPPPEKPMSESAQIQFRKTVGLELANQLEPQLTFRQESDISTYLEQVAEKIVDSTKGFLLPDINVALIKAPADATWKDYALPGGRLYLSIAALKQMKYQNEVAALIAMQLAHIRGEDLLEYFAKKQTLKENAAKIAHNHSHSPAELDPIPKKIDYFSSNGAFAFDEGQVIEAVQTAVDLLYSAGYDPRGMVSLWQMYLSHPAHSPYEKEFLKKMLEETRRKIAQKAPLRNPIVKTEGFIAIRKGIENL